MMCDQPRSEARSPRCEDEEAWKKDREVTNKGQTCSSHQTGLCALDKVAPDGTMHRTGHRSIFSARHTFVFRA